MQLSPTTLVIPLFAVLIAIEAHIARFKGSDEFADPFDTAANIALGFGSVAFNFMFGLVTGLIFLFLYEHSTFKFPANAWWTWVLLFFVDDFVYYWFHRISHESRILWNFHVVHHSSEHFNLSVAGRQSWFSGVAHWIFYAPLMLLGFAPWMFALMHGLNLVYQFWIHTRLVDRLGWFEYVFNTPSHHRVHHGINEQYLDKNYAGVLIIWDRIFGTFIPETEKPRYGIIKQLNSHNPVWINTHAWVEMYEAMRSRRNFWLKIRCIFDSPYMDKA
jgi:sterol desaturase/sphingolipid hydroxylase (fatty acid hydroxylase superfamily)